MRRLLEHVIELPEELLPSLSLQDAALCHLCHLNGTREFAAVPGFERIDARIRQWLAVARPAHAWSEGKRTQTLLRELIDRLQANNVGTLARDELDLLETVHALAQAAQAAETFARVQQLIAPYRPRIAERRARMPEVSGLPTLTSRYLVVRAEDILQAPQREVRVLAGVELPLRGPVLVHTGHVRVLGDVPEATTLVVEEADCVVDGYVMGRVAVSGYCEVLENVSGVVISRNGDVRARNIVDNAFVVSKRGRVQCRRVHGARMVFAGEVVHVAETSVRSHLVAPTVLIDQDVRSGCIHASCRISAARFGESGDAIDLYLCRGLSCRDYGEDPGREMTIDVTRALQARGTLQCVRSQMSLALQGAEQSAETCLTYLLAEEDSARIAEEVCASQRRLDMLSRIVLGLRAIYAQVEAYHADMGDVEFSAKPGRPTAAERIGADLAAIVEDAPANDPVRAMYDELKATRNRLVQERPKHLVLQSTLEEIAGKLETWRAEAGRLRESIRRGQKSLAQSGRIKDMLGGDSAAKSRVIAFHRIVDRARAEPRESRLRARAESTFITTMSRTIEKRLAEARKLKAETDATRREFEEARRKVWNLYQMRIDDEDGIERAISVEGAFEGRVRMYVDPRLNRDTRGGLPDAHAFVPSPSHSGRVRYVCAGGRIREMPLAPHEPESVKGALAGV